MTNLPDRFSFCVGSVLVATANTFATGTGAALDVRGYRGLVAAVLQTDSAVGAGRTLAVRIQDSPDGLTDWVDLPGAAFPVVSTPSAGVGLFITFDADACRGWVRGSWTIANATAWRWGVYLLGRQDS